MRYSEMIKLFKQKYPDAYVDDYRPASIEYVKDKCGITIWLANGDVMLWFPKEENDFKPCAFCGGTAIYKKRGKKHMVHCAVCGLGFTTDPDCEDIKFKDVLDIWNSEYAEGGIYD